MQVFFVFLTHQWYANSFADIFFLVHAKLFGYKIDESKFIYSYLIRVVQIIGVAINFGSKTIISIPDGAKIHFGGKVLETNSFTIYEL